MRGKIILLGAVVIAALLIVLLTPSDPPAPRRGARAVGPAHAPARASPASTRTARPTRAPIALTPATPGTNSDAASVEAEVQRREALAARGITPRKLYGSRAGGRLTYLGIAARQLGEPALADAAEALGKRMWQTTDPGRPETELDALLVEQAALVARFQDFARQHPDDPALIVLVGQVHEDLVATASGKPRPIDRKLETEDDEGPRRNETDDDDDKGAGAPVTSE